MTHERENSWGFSLFGDDLRWEIGGKMSVMGLYGSDYIFQGSFPLLMSKFAILIMYFEVWNRISSDVLFTVQAPGPDSSELTVAEVTLLRKDVPSPPEKEPGTDEHERLMHARFPILISPLQIPRDGGIKVRAHYDDGTVLRLGTLRVRPAGPEESALFPNAPRGQ